VAPAAKLALQARRIPERPRRAWSGGRRYVSISEMAAEKIDRGYLGRVLQLTLLAPDIVEAILDGRQPEGLGLPRLLQPFPTAWDDQVGPTISRRVP
jgi:hypothetical protein